MSMTFLKTISIWLPLKLCPRECHLHAGVNLITLLQGQFTSVAIVFGLLNNAYTCKLQVQKFY